jgi:hypothetical protein
MLLLSLLVMGAVMVVVVMMMMMVVVVVVVRYACVIALAFRTALTLGWFHALTFCAPLFQV